MRKSLLIIVIIFMIIISNIAIVQAATATAEFNTSKTSVKHGETFTVTLSVACSAGINGVITDYTYDTEKLELIEHKADEKYMDLNGDSTSKIETMISSGSITSSDIFILTFKVKDSAQIGSNAIISTGTITVDSDTDSELTVQPKSVSIQIVEDNNNNDDNSSNNNNSNNSNDNSNNDNSSIISNNNNNDKSNNNNNNNNSNNNTGIKTNGSSSITSSNIPAKATDKTTATSNLPKTGFITITGILLILVTVLSIVMFKKLKKYDGIE